jgi:cytosine/adenosine deaminase-related metal-dependent hydrolase
MQKIILSGPAIFTNDSPDSFFESGAVVVGDGQVLQVGRVDKIKQENPGLPVKDIGGGLLAPGLVNLHHHLYSSFARGWSPPGIPATNFKEILERVWWRLDESLQLNDIYYSQRLSGFVNQPWQA